MQAVRRPAAAVALTLVAVAGVLSSCSSSSDQPSNAAAPDEQASAATSPAAGSSAPADGASADSSPAAGGTTTATPQKQPLDWTTLSHSTYPVVTNGSWTLAITKKGRAWSLGAAGKAAHTTAAPAGLKVLDVQLSDSYAVAVYGDEQMRKPQRVAVTDLTSGKVRAIDASSTLPPAAEGSYALDGSTLWRPTEKGHAFCLASTDLSSGSSTLGWCAPKNGGWTNVIAGGGKTSLLAFDDAQPSCRTVVSVAGAKATPYPGVPPCHGAEGADLGDAGTVWAIVPNEKRYQQTHVYATAGSATTDLGLGVNGTLALCGGAAYWSRDATGSSPAALMRWDGSTLSTAYETDGYLGKPLCGGDTLTVPVAGGDGTTQLSATVS